MFNDTYYTNKYIAQVGGVSLQNINELETFFIEMIDWNLNITEDQYVQYERLIAAFLQPQSPFIDPSFHSVQSAMATGHASPNSQSINPAYPYQGHTVPGHNGAMHQNPQAAVQHTTALEYQQQRIHLQNLQLILQKQHENQQRQIQAQIQAV